MYLFKEHFIITRAIFNAFLLTLHYVKQDLSKQLFVDAHMLITVIKSRSRNRNVPLQSDKCV